jgi:CRISPR-associated protein Csa1
MYFLNEEERLLLYKGIIPQSRAMYIDESMRGWNWQNPPLEPIYDIRLGVFEVANNYCPNNRDLYLRRVLNISATPNFQMIEGAILHEVITLFITQAKRELYSIDMKDIYQDNFLNLSEENINKLLDYRDNVELKEKIRLLWNYEKQKVIFRLQEVLSRQPYIGIDSLIYQVLPVVVEHKLNGTFLGLSPHLSTDAVNFSEPMIVDIKFGQKKDFHKLSVTGYALVMEAIHSFPVNIGFLVYPVFKGNRILVEKEFVLIDDELRQKFIDIRDEKMRMIYQEDDPGIPDNCYQICPFYKECR